MMDDSDDLDESNRLTRLKQTGTCPQQTRSQKANIVLLYGTTLRTR